MAENSSNGDKTDACTTCTPGWSFILCILMSLDLSEDMVVCQPYLAHVKAEGIFSYIKA